MLSAWKVIWGEDRANTFAGEVPIRTTGRAPLGMGARLAAALGTQSRSSECLTQQCHQQRGPCPRLVKPKCLIEAKL